MALMTSSQSNMALKYFNSKLYRFRAQPFKVQLLDFLGQISRPFTTLPTRETFACLLVCSVEWIGGADCLFSRWRTHARKEPVLPAEPSWPRACARAGCGTAMDDGGKEGVREH